jgi:cystathionine beta-lyase
MKWDAAKEASGRDDIIPMWVADMDFPAAQPIIEALQKRAEHPFYGYTRPGPEVIEAVIERAQRKGNWRIEPEWIVFTPGVIPALAAAVRSLTHPGDGVILQEPVYFPFFPVIESAGCRIVNSGLRLENGRYEMDYADLEAKLGETPESGRVKTIILCNPHNPIGRLWSEGEVSRLGEIAVRHGVVVIADEIHSEILYRGYRHVPFASISKDFAQNCIVCTSPSKTFNLAGLGISAIIIPNERLREAFQSTRATILPEPSLFGYTALTAAYRYGDEWLEQLLDYLQGNLDFLTAYFTERIPEIKITPPQGTYMVWLDCRSLGLDNQALSRFMREKARLWLNDGYVFGEAGSGFQRMNIACPRPLLAEACKRLEAAVKGL